MLSRTDFFAVALSALVALLIVSVVVIAGVSGLERPQAQQGAGPEPTCAEWTDGCVVCQRGPQGLACSTPGIACTRTAPRCLRP